VNSTLEQLLEQLAEEERTLSASKQRVEEMRSEVVGRMEDLGIASTTTDGGYRVTVVRGTIVSWDVEVLKDILVPRGLWERARTIQEVVDEAAIERMVDLGEIGLDEIQPAVNVKARKPYPKVSKQ
jgi:hypothetical protein